MAEPASTPTEDETQRSRDDLQGAQDTDGTNAAEAPAAVAVPAGNPQNEPVPTRTDRAAADDPRQAPVADTTAAAAPVTAPEPVAAATEPVRPTKRSNRLFATGIVLLSALLFEVVYLGLVELVAFIVGGASSEGPALKGVISSGLVWVPLVVFAVLYELVVLLLNRAGRFAYVIASLVVGILVFLAAIVFVLITEAGAITATGFSQLLVNPLFVLAGLAAREVMLWTGFAVGAHGKRLRRKNREARQEYEHDQADAA